MQRISAWSDLVAPGGLFRYGSLALGVPPTPLSAEWLNMLQEELAHVVLNYLPALDKNDDIRKKAKVTATRQGTGPQQRGKNDFMEVMGNLLDNACKYCLEFVEVSARQTDNELHIIVEDDGPGIPDHALDRIFERFYTDRPEGESFGQNSGLGLSISRQIAEAHGGTLKAENLADPAGHMTGARFILSLPAGQPA